MGRIPDDVIERVLAAHDIAEVVGRYVTLKRAGRAFKALCPFHEEKTASFTVNPDRQTFKCFGCQKGGTVITFLMEHAKVTFPEAVRSLAQERGIEVPDARDGGGPPPGELERVRAALDLAQRMYSTLLQREEGRSAKAYLEKRGYDLAAQQRFGLGYAPEGWDRLLKAAELRKMPPEVLEKAGLVVPRTTGSGWYDRFRNRITFPVRDLQGRVVSFGARALSPDDNPKYLNGPETAVFRKGDLLFALDLAKEGLRKQPTALLMEGYTDVLMAHLHGFDRAVAGMGTALTPQQAARLHRCGADRVVVVYDGDAAGLAAAEKNVDILLEEGLEVRVAVLAKGRDVDEVLLEEGPPAFQAVIDAAQDVFAFRLEQLGGRLDLKTPRGAAAAAAALAPTLARVKDAVERDLWIRTLVSRLGGGEETERALRRDVAAQGKRAEHPARAAPRAPIAPGVPETPWQRSRSEGQRMDEQVLLAALLEGGVVAEEIARAVGPEDFSDTLRQRIYKAVLDMREGGAPHDVHAVLARFADDPELGAELASLPESEDVAGPPGRSAVTPLAERARAVIKALEARRRASTREEALRRARSSHEQEPSIVEIVDTRHDPASPSSSSQASQPSRPQPSPPPSTLPPQSPPTPSSSGAAVVPP